MSNTPHLIHAEEMFLSYGIQYSLYHIDCDSFTNYMNYTTYEDRMNKMEQGHAVFFALFIAAVMGEI